MGFKIGGSKQTSIITDQVVKDDGMSIIATALLILVVGAGLAAGSKIYNLFGVQGKAISTNQKMIVIQDALHEFLINTNNGRYPCPADLTSPIDAADGSFGVEVTADCSVADGSVGFGTFRGTGRDGRMVRIGTIPVRSLGLPDDYIYDEWGSRFVYAVTESEATDATADPFGDSGAIFIRDTSDSSATSIDGNISHLVMSMGPDENGAFSRNGSIKQVCDTSVSSGANCDFMILGEADTDSATFTNTLNKSQNENAMMAHRMNYRPSMTVIACDDADIGNIPLNVSLMLDTSGSMSKTDTPCPIDLAEEGLCSRMEVAHWAIRRVIPARLHTNSLIEDAGVTRFEGFVARKRNRQTDAVALNNTIDELGDYTFDDPTLDDYEAMSYDAIAEKIEDELSDKCPTGSTPLGLHVQAMAEALRRTDYDTSDEDKMALYERPDKIMIISDGRSNNGIDPEVVAQQIADDPELAHIEVDIFFTADPETAESDGPKLRRVANATGGNFFSAQDPDVLLDTLRENIGSCGAAPPAPPPDQDNC